MKYGAKFKPHTFAVNKALKAEIYREGMGWQYVTIRWGVGDVRQIRNKACILLEIAIYFSHT